MQHTYYNAIKSLREYPLSVEHPNQLLKLKFFGEKTVTEINKKLISYCNENNYQLPKELIDEPVISKSKAKRSLTDDTTISKKKRNVKKKSYIPAKNSGGYAILIALYLNDKLDNGLTKNQIIQFGIPYCSTSFNSNPRTGNFYSAWNGIKTLINNDYIDETSSTPKYYSLTPSGKNVAKLLKDSMTEEDEIFTNNIENVSNRSFTYPSDLNVGDQFSKRKNPLISSSPNISNKDIYISSSPIKSNLLKELDQLKNNIDERINDNNNKKLIDDKEYQIWDYDSYEIKFILDNREIFSKEDRDMFSKMLKSLGVNLEVRTLPVGDGLWIAINKKTKQETTLNYIFERKRLDDLAESIKDGRYREQKSRLEKTGMKTIFYIIEEQMGSDISKFSDAIKTCISMNSTYSNFHTKRTKSFDETIQLIKDLTNQLKKKYSKLSLLVLEPRNLDNQIDYKNHLINIRNQYIDKEVVYSFNTFNEIMNKNNAITVKEIFIKMLMTIKGISLEKACAIQQFYKTPNNLINLFKRSHLKGKCNQMLHLQFKNEVGIRNIGNVLSKRIASVFCMDCANSN